jgi:hypothetical protein
MNSPKVGDIKKCTKCGEEKAKYERLTTDAYVVHEDTKAVPERPGDRYAWQCDACGFEDRVPS